MRRLLFIILILTANYAFGQKNVIKGRIFAFPIFGYVTYSLGIGYERLLSNNISVQVLFNNYGDAGGGGGDAGSRNTYGFVPETRYYFGKMDSFRNQYFVGVFIEFLRTNESAGYPDPTDIGYYDGSVINMVNPGILVGKNISLGKKKKWHLDIYIGGKFQFMSKTENAQAQIY